VAQACYRRLITPRGTLQPVDDTLGGDEEGAYGFDVAGYCGAVGYATAVKALPAQVRGELLKDDRLLPTLDVRAAITQGTDGLDSIVLEISGDLADESASFDLTLAINDVSVAILGGLA
jgi:hypothetical protein